MTFLCDSNVWIALALANHAHHARARRWLDTVDEAESILFCRSTQQSFLRLLTTKSILEPYGLQALSNIEAWALYDTILADPRIALQRHEPPGLNRRWRHYAIRDSASPKLWMDAYLAAFAQTAGCHMVTTDSAFSQFDGLDLVLIGPSNAD